MFTRPKRRFPKRKTEEGLNNEYVKSEWFMDEQLFSFDCPADAIRNRKEELGLFDIDCDENINKDRAELNRREANIVKYINMIDREKL